jgi:hypothetical protein
MITAAHVRRSQLAQRLVAWATPLALGLGLALNATPSVAGGGVSWSVNVQLPPVGVVVAGRPHHQPHYGPPPAVVYAPPPTIYVAPPPVVYAPPPRVVYAPVVVGYGHHGHRHGGHGHWKDRDRDGIPDRWERRHGWNASPHPHGPPPGVVYRGW